MARLLFGVETEYALATGFDGHHCGELPREAAAARLIEEARLRIPSLPGKQSPGLFLQNGSRLYRDRGDHPELATPEVSDPWNQVRYLKAGDRILETLADACDVVLFKSNVDYSGTHSTWGSHESYLYDGVRLSDLAIQLIPHLVSRLVYTGSGGFNPFCPGGIEFVLSPRVWFLKHAVSGETMGNDRGIVNSREEALAANGYHRLHLICGESLQSETSSFLRCATTALVVAMINAGLPVGQAVQLVDPLAAMRTFAGDPTCRATAPATRGQALSALGIQRHLLSLSREHCREAFMPKWTPAACELWGQMLDRLEQGPEASGGCLDWSIKYPCFRAHAEDRGFSWELIERWNSALRGLPVVTPEDDGAADSLRIELLRLLNTRTQPCEPKPLSERSPQLRAITKANKLDIEQWRPLQALRRELFELDIRYAQLGSASIFASLERAGVLDHHVVGVDNIERATIKPPHGRAGVRGKWIRKFSRHPKNRFCEWQGIWDGPGGRVLDLSNPFATKPQWQRVREEGLDTHAP